MFKVNNRNTRTRCEICLRLTIKIPGKIPVRESPYSSIFYAVMTFCIYKAFQNGKYHIKGINIDIRRTLVVVPVSFLLTLNKYFPCM